MLHPNINAVMGFYKIENELRLVLQYMPRGSLFNVLHQIQLSLPLRLKISMAIDCALGLNYLHLCQPKVLHRDFKSPNLLVGRDFKVVIGDLGLSRRKIESTAMTRCGSPGIKTLPIPNSFYNFTNYISLLHLYCSVGSSGDYSWTSL